MIEMLDRRDSFSLFRPQWLVFCWLLIALISTTALHMQREGLVSWWAILPVKLAVWLFWGLYAVLIFRLTRQFGWDPRQRWKTLAIHLPFSVLTVLIHVFFYSWIVYLLNLGGMQALGLTAIFHLLLPALFEWYFIIYWTIVIFTLAFDYFRKFRDQELRSLQLEKQLILAQLQALKMQLQPHFLFNTLNTIVSQVRLDQKETAVRMLSGLSELLRITLKHSQHHLVPLSEEISYVQQYLELEKDRFGDRLDIGFEIEPATRELEIPSFLLQPLVENAVYHGLARQLNARELRIRSRLQEGRLEIEIYNDGPALPTDFDPAYYSGIGLSNTIERLSQFYGDDCTFEIRNSGAGVLVRLRLPQKNLPHAQT
ncbi:sensor histidine kinase [Flavilitoribacter nigricans]|uniref:Signal transduction histidine kinase internal region domain-containing protein n=1 Tax=Flavilitoribacter nigricans (strain ATCC 23147 / DSM 23189 / NBRC 102662 / NCIMB 1420 / SS-2) TaxID=1122177 RepID=A0A2D0N4B7_FLAN2|nr:histidine kinase [Flavilitoribacter nigricans]PHN03287.1 hypothetical protein CRP01_28250 [Flavilitoribacter nigricans DSM 23189 = NBRC 102662]